MKFSFLVLMLLVAGAAFAQEPNTKLYIMPEGPNKTVDGGNRVVTTSAGAFHLVMQAGLMKEKAPFVLVTDPAQADYTMSWDVQTGQASGYPYRLTASVANKDGQIVWAGNSAGQNLNHCAEVIAKHLKDAMKHKK
jgi:hypothetical protein